MLYEKIENQKEVLDEEVYEIPSYITENLRYTLYDWQKKALENFLINERLCEKKIKKGEIVSPNNLMFNMATGSGKTLVMAALILYYYKQGYRNFIFFVNQNAILGKTQANFIDSTHNKYLFTENIVIDGVHVNTREVEQFSDSCDDIQIKFTSIQKLHNDIYKESENALLLSDLQKRDVILFGDEAHHLNATTSKKKSSDSANELTNDISFIGELREGAKDEDIERTWEHTVCHCILNKNGNQSVQNKNALLEFTATIPNTEEVRNKYEDKIITKFDLKDFVEAGCTKHIRLVRSNLDLKERILQALLLNWYRYEIATKAGIANFKPVILFRSKEIENSKSDYQNFVELCKNVNAENFDFVQKMTANKITSTNPMTENTEESSYILDERIFERIDHYIEENSISFDTVAQYIRENFQERNIIITNSKTNKTKKEKTDSEIDRLLNSLEDANNHIRAIFTVQRLTEGWDVLNLYDIVRLYEGRDMDFHNKKAGSSTTSEVQLIGRGVRYFPFAYKDKEKSRRKFDDDLQNPLRILEEFYFHSDEDHRYISELSAELKNRGLIQEKRTQKVFSVKKEKQAELNGMYLFVNEQKENPNRRLKTLPEDFEKLPPFPYIILTNLYSEIQAVNFSQKEDERFVAESQGLNTQTIKFSEIPTHIKYKAIHRLNTNSASYFSFENLRKRFNIETSEDFFDFLKDVKITLTSDSNYDDIPNKKILKLCEDFFLYVQGELESYDKPYIGSDFRLVKFSDIFSFDEQKGKVCFKKEKMILIDDSKSETTENMQLENELKNKNWYTLDSFWGTEEERNLIEFIKNHESNLLQKYESFQLLRNEEVYKIFDFETGRGFQPDFLLFLHGKEKQQNTYFQVFIEPKGSHLAGEDNDGWKQDFLKEISKRYGLENIVMEKSDGYVLIGLPFFNASDVAMNEKFEESFKIIS
ncbi:MAG: DEAD/DEAH box helicase family protein [Treponema sp.]|nr:DEAD/DEAH box helicase family protein [Treponema sp.]